MRIKYSNLLIETNEIELTKHIFLEQCELSVHILYEKRSLLSYNPIKEAIFLGSYVMDRKYKEELEQISNNILNKWLIDGYANFDEKIEGMEFVKNEEVRWYI